MAKLEAVAEELKAINRGCQVKIVQASFGGADHKEVADRITESLLEQDLALLVNNVGLADPPHIASGVGDPECPVTFRDYENTVNVDVMLGLQITTAILPRMEAAARASKARRAIINVGSTLGLGPSPKMAVYSGAKAFTHMWSLSLRAEMQDRGVDILVYHPGPTDTSST